jgi:hypothetical protein
MRFIYWTLRKGIVTSAAARDGIDEIVAYLEQT